MTNKDSPEDVPWNRGNGTLPCIPIMVNLAGERPSFTAPRTTTRGCAAWPRGRRPAVYGEGELSSIWGEYLFTIIIPIMMIVRGLSRCGDHRDPRSSSFLKEQNESTTNNKRFDALWIACILGYSRYHQISDITSTNRLIAK
jgi:hypothetical protein